MLERILNFCRPRQASAAREQYARGAALYEQGLYEQAAQCLRELRDGSAPSLPATVGLRPPAGADALAQTARYYEGMSLRALGLSCLMEGQFAGAEQYLCQAAKLLGPEADLASYLASLYAQTGRFGQCARHQEKVPLQGAAENAQKLAQAQWQSGQREQAMITLADAMLAVGPDARLNLQMGLFHAAREEFHQAVECLTLAARTDCTSAKAHHWLGLAAMAAGDLRLAIRSLQRALQLRPTDVMLAYQLAMAARTAAGEGCRIVVQLPQDLVLQPNTTLAEQLAGFVTTEKEFVEAFLSLPPSPVDKELFGTLAGIVQVALAQNENYADLQYILAAVQRRLGQADQALEHARAAVRINPRYVSARLMLADLLDRQQRPEEAVEHLKAAIGCGADWPDIHCQAGNLMLRNNQPLRAREHFRRALELNANYEQAAGALKNLAA